MTRILDAGALIAIERGDARLAALLKRDRRNGRPAVTHGGVVGQVWRNGSRQALLAAALRSIRVVALDEERGRRAGALLARAGSSDVIDAALVDLAADVDSDAIYTSDVDDVAVLLRATGRRVAIVRVSVRRVHEPRRLRISAVMAGTTWWRSPITA
jgi:hypothetical protein